VADPTPPLSSSLASRAIARLRKLAAGNGLDPSSLTAFETQEQILTLEGRIEVSPLCQTQSVSHVGGPRGKSKEAASSFAELQRLVENHRSAFNKSTDWIDAAVRELKSHESKGWGLQSAKVTLPEKSAVFSATEMCPSCQGRKMLTCEQCFGKGLVVCTQCQGHGQEPCYYCNGRGEDPQRPEQLCPICNGTRYAPCRFCQTQGQLPCPTCKGNRGTPCTTCKGTGAMTQEVEVVCGAETHFILINEGLPSGLRRGLDRIGIENLGKGHADITVEDVPKKKEEEEPPPEQGAKIPVLTYKAVLPYAEIKIDLGGKKALISAVGKRCAISGVPNFLDNSLKSWRDKLHMAAFGEAPLEEALQARAFKEILSLIVSGKSSERDVRRIYPFGLSSEFIGTAITDLRAALKKVTLKTRAFMACFCGALCAAFFYAFFVTGYSGRLMVWGHFGSDLVLDLIALMAALGISWVVLNFSTRFVLQCRFPGMPHALHQNIGKTGGTMFAGIIGTYILFLIMAPVKPLWLAQLLQ